MRRAPVEANTPMAVAMTLLWTSKGPKENPDLIRRSLPIFQIENTAVEHVRSKTLGGTLVPTRYARGTLSSTESAAPYTPVGHSSHVKRRTGAEAVR